MRCRSSALVLLGLVSTLLSPRVASSDPVVVVPTVQISSLGHFYEPWLVDDVQMGEGVTFPCGTGIGACSGPGFTAAIETLSTITVRFEAPPGQRFRVTHDTLMGADAIADEDITGLGAKIVRGGGSPFRGLIIPESSLSAYMKLIREKLTPGFWNDILGRRSVFFILKLADGTVRDLTLSEETRSEIARLCSSLNKDPIEKTSDMPRYLAGNPFYREMIEAFYARSDA